MAGRKGTRTKTAGKRTPAKKKAETKKRGPNVSLNDFIVANEEVAAAGGKLQDVATRLGISVGGVSTRRSNLNKKLEAAGQPKLTEFPKGGGRKFSATDAADALAKIRQSLKAKETREEAEPETAN